MDFSHHRVSNCFVLLLIALLLRQASTLPPRGIIKDGLHRELHKAIEDDDAGEVEELLEKHFDKQVNIANSTGFSPLHVAAHVGSKKVAEFLILKGANFNEIITPSPGREQPIHLAALNGQHEMVDFLLKTGPQLASVTNGTTEGAEFLTEAEASNGETALFYACKSSKRNEAVLVVRKLLEHGANIYHEDANGLQPLHRAVMASNFEIVKAILTHDSRAAEALTRSGKTISHLAAEFNLADFVRTSYFNASSVDKFGQTPSCVAAFHGSLEFAKKYPIKTHLNVGRCIYAHQANQTAPPLHIAALNRKRAYVEMLISDSIRVNVGTHQDSAGWTALHAMATVESQNQREDHAVVELLSRRNKRIIEAVDFLGRTPFHIAAMWSSREFADMLRLDFGAKLFAVDTMGYSALHLAKDSRFVDYLLGVSYLFHDINQRTNPSAVNLLTGSATPLIVATAEKKPVELLNFFIAQKADTNAVNDHGKSAVHVAIDVNYQEAIDAFLVPEFNFSLRDSAGRTPLIYAIKLGRIEIAKMILNSAVGEIVAGETAPGTFDTPLHFASRNNAVELAKLLLEKNSEALTMQNVNGQTPLHEAVVNQHFEMVQLLAGEGAPLDVVDKFGRTPLHLTVPCTPIGLEIAHELLGNRSSSEANIFEISDNFGQPLLHLATLHNCVDFVNYYLINHPNKASCTKLNRDGLSPLHLAKKMGYVKLAQSMIHTGKCSANQLDNCGNDVSKIDHKKPRTCGELPEIDNGVFEVESNCISAKGVLRCNFGSELIGSSIVTIHCESNGKWKIKGAAHCEKIVAPRDCEDIIKIFQPNATNGIYEVTPAHGHRNRPMRVYCDMTIYGGGWTVFQRRVDGTQTFYLDWATYKNGFGNLEANFWLGNDNIHRLTGGLPETKRYSLLIGIKRWDNSVFGIAYYDNVYIEDEVNKYRLRLNKFVCGNITNDRDQFTIHNGMAFSTRDQDNDNNGGSCVGTYEGAWWYNSCIGSNLNGVYRNSGYGINWGGSTSHNMNYSSPFTS